MTLNSSDEEVIAARRHRVAQLRLRGATQREIAHAVACSVGTVNGDLAALRQEWRDAAAVDIAEHQATVLAELREVRRAAWAQSQGKGLLLVLQSLKQECALLGLDAPAKTALTNLDGTPAQYAELRAVVINLLAPYPDLRLALAAQLAEDVRVDDQSEN